MNRVRARRFALEMGVIVVSILMAFGIQAWWDLRREDVHRTEFLRQLRGDFSSTHALLETAIEDARDRWGRTRQFSGWAQGAMELPLDSVEVLASGLYSASSFVPMLAHYDAAKSSGDIGLVEDDSLQVLFHRFDESSNLFEVSQDLSSEVFFLGAMHDVRLRFGTQRGFLETDDPLSSGRTNVVVAAAQTTEILQASAVLALERMADEVAEIIAGLDRVLATR